MPANTTPGGNHIPFGSRAAEQIARLGSYSGVQTAITGGGPVPISENWWAFDTTNVWQTTLGGTGAATLVGSNNGRGTININSAAALDTVALSSRRRIWKGGWQTTSPSTRRMYTKTVVEWEWMVDTNLANFDNTTFFMGLALAHADTRATDNVIGFGLSGDALITVSDSGGAEETNTPTAPAGGLTIVHKYAMVLDVDSIRFYIDDVLEKTHTAQGHGNAAFFTVYQAAEAGGACNSQLGPVRAYYVPNPTLLA